ncbi:MAG: CvpA family protein [Pseudomonadota bacterium]
MELTIADGVVALVVVVSALLAYNRGLVRELLAISGWFVATLAAFQFAPMVAPLLLEAPYLGDVLLNLGATVTVITAFVVVFGIALIILSFFTPLLSSAIHGTLLGPIDKGLGFVFGVGRGVALVAVVYLLYNIVITDDERIAMIEDSASIALIGDAARIIEENSPTEVPDWLQNRIDRLIEQTPTAPEDQAHLIGRDAAG